MKLIKSNIHGFSLVEVTIAMAIAAVAVVTLLGLLPQGLDTMREAGDTAIKGRINQQIVSEVQMTDFDVIDKIFGGRSQGDPLRIFYNDQGEEIGDSVNGGLGGGGAPEGSFEHVYTARVSIPEKGNPLPESVGGENFEGISFDRNSPNDNLRAVIVEIAVVGGNAQAFDFDDEDNFKQIDSYQTVVVRTGQTYLR